MEEPSTTIRVSYPEEEEFFLEGLQKMPRLEGVISFTTGQSFLLVFVTVTAVVAVMTHHYHRRGDSLWWIPLVVGPGLIPFLWFISLSSSARRRALRKELKKHLKVPPEQGWFEFGTEGFLSGGAGGRSSHFPWSTIPRAVVRSDGLHIFIDQATAFWVPVRLFSDRQGFEQLTNLIRSKVAKTETSPV